MTTPDNKAIVSFLIVARNAGAFLGDLLNDYVDQDYPKTCCELVIVDGMSVDNTRQIGNEFRDEHPELKVTVLDNPKRILASGWNVGLAAAKGDIMIRVDAHAHIGPDFIRRNVERIEAGEQICGGCRSSDPPIGALARMVNIVETSKFGGGLAAFRNRGPARYVDTHAHAAYRREVFAAVGGLDERLERNQDNEIHYRMRKAGYRFYFDPCISSRHISRSTVPGLLRQKFGNGFWVGILLGIQPRSVGIRHAASLALVLSILAGAVLLQAFPFLLMAVVGAYSLLDLFFTVEIIREAEPSQRLLATSVFAIFPMLHIVYGLGTICGLVKMPFVLLATRNYHRAWPVEPMEGVTCGEKGQAWQSLIHE